VINHGKLLAAGSPADLRSRSSEPRLYVNGRFAQQALERLQANPLVTKMEQHNGQLVFDLVDLSRSHELVTQMVQLGAQIDEVRREKADLEQVFLNLVEEEQGGEA
jgi:ABC-2 type transport system ATP-binding protein